MNFLDSVQMEMAQLDLTKVAKELAEPQYPVEKDKGEKVVGEVEEDTRKLFVLSSVWAKVAMELIVEARFCGNRKQAAELIVRAQSLQEKSKLVSELFWTSIKDSLELWSHNGNVGVRAGWKVVTIKQDEPPIIQSLRDLFGF